MSLLQSGNENTRKIIACGLQKEQYLLLQLRDDAAISQMIPSFDTDYSQKLDVSIVDHFILEELTGLTPESSDFHVAYTHDADKAVKLVSSREYQLAFLVNPVKPEVIKTIADRGDRMPKKSTYFYPKMPAGLIFYRFIS